MADHKAIAAADIHVPGYVQSTDPGAIGAGKIWVDTTTAGAWLIKVRNVANSGWETAGGSAGGAPTGADYLTGSAQAGLSAEIVVGTTPGGELGGSWASPTVDAAHSGSTHAATQAAAESTASGALTTHAAAADPHTGYRLESASIGTADVAARAVTYPKIQAVASNNRVLGRVSGAAGDIEELTAAQFMALVGAPNVQVFSSGSGNWSKPAGARFVLVEVVGGGGGGGSTTTTASGQRSAGGGGGGGAYARKVLAASVLGATEAYAVGAAGAAGSLPGGTGGTGGDSTFGAASPSWGTQVKGTGGVGGVGMTNSANAADTAAGGAGGAATGGDINAPGQSGSMSRINASTLQTAGDGGSSGFAGNGGRALAGGGASAAGEAGKVYGGGGGAGGILASTTQLAGGAGAAGVVIVTTYF